MRAQIILILFIAIGCVPSNDGQLLNNLMLEHPEHFSEVLVDPDKRLKEAMALKDAHVMRPDTMLLDRGFDKKQRERLEVSYYDYDAQVLKEFFYLDSPASLRAFHYRFARMHTKLPGTPLDLRSLNDVLENQNKFRMPSFLVARKKKYFWEIREKVF